ncbi:aminotransferase class IV [Streptomyces sp. NPDC050433]|uniref:aminotransferase class IV n=1 Tax=unclassified Streptomyces TaxID=2593676 RepID=UPI0034300EE8
MSALSTPAKIWFNGKVTDWEQATLHVWTDPVLRAASVFEGIRGYWVAEEQRHYLVHFDKHMRRLQQSARLLGLPVEDFGEEFRRAVEGLIAALAYREDIYLRPTVYLERGGYSREASRMRLGSFMPVFPAPREDSIDTGVTCTVSSWQRAADSVIPPRAKTAANYHAFRLARMEASERGADEAIMLNSRGQVAETGGASVFVVRDGQVFTPPIGDSILESITRESVIRLLVDDLGVTVTERSVDRTELLIADEVFLTGTLCELTPVRQIDGLAVGSSVPGPTTLAVQRRYLEECRSGARQKLGWLTEGPVL